MLPLLSIFLHPLIWFLWWTLTFQGFNAPFGAAQSVGMSCSQRKLWGISSKSEHSKGFAQPCRICWVWEGGRVWSIPPGCWDEILLYLVALRQFCLQEQLHGNYRAGEKGFPNSLNLWTPIFTLHQHIPPWLSRSAWISDSDHSRSQGKINFFVPAPHQQLVKIQNFIAQEKIFQV